MHAIHDHSHSHYLIGCFTPYSSDGIQWHSQGVLRWFDPLPRYGYYNILVLRLSVTLQLAKNNIVYGNAHSTIVQTQLQYVLYSKTQ